MQLLSSKRIVSSEKGFILLTAIMACVILLALTVLMINISTRDLQMSSTNVGAKKAMLAAEAGIHDLMRSWNIQNKGVMTITDVPVDATNDPGSFYNAYDNRLPTAAIPAGIEMPGYGIAGQTWGRMVVYIEVEGRSTSYKTTATIATGIGYGPCDITTMMR